MHQRRSHQCVPHLQQLTHLHGIHVVPNEELHPSTTPLLLHRLPGVYSTHHHLILMTTWHSAVVGSVVVQTTLTMSKTSLNHPRSECQHRPMFLQSQLRLLCRRSIHSCRSVQTRMAPQRLPKSQTRVLKLSCLVN